MHRVWIVVRDFYDGEEIIAVYKRHKDANKKLAELQAESNYPHDYKVNVHEVQ